MALKITDEVEKILCPYLAQNGLRIYDTVFVKEGQDKVLRVFIDRQDGLVSIDECEEVSRFLSDELDRADLIEEAYVLEVSSPGIERQIKYDWHFKEGMGKKVQVKLFKKVKDSKLLIGVLKEGTEKGDVTISVDGEDITIERSNIVDVRIYFEF